MKTNPSPRPDSVHHKTPPTWDREQISKLAQGLGALLDASLTIPGTTIKIGLDPLLGLIPGIGDLISNAIGSSLLFLAAKAGVPRIVIFRMSLNILLNMGFGAIPVLGDIFSIWFKSNVRNAQLLHRYCQTRYQPVPLADWLYVSGIVLGIIFAFLVIVGGMMWLGFTLISMINTSA